MIKGVAAGFLAYALYSGSDASVKALGGTMSVYEILFFTTLVSLLTFGFAKPADERWSDLFRMRRPALVVLRAVLAAVSSLLSGYAFTTLPFAEAYSLLFLMPAFATLLAIPFLGDRIGWRRGLAIAAGFAGVVLVVRPGFHELHLGHLAAGLSAVTSAGTMIVLRALGPSEKRISLLSSLYAVALIVDGGLMLAGFTVPGPREIAIIVVGGLVGGFGQIAMLVAARLAPPNRVAPTQYSQIIWAVVFGAAFFGEFPDVAAFAGMALVAASGLFTFLREEQLYGWSRRTLLLRNRQ